MSGLRRICKAFGGMTLSDKRGTRHVVWDYAADEPVDEADMPDWCLGSGNACRGVPAPAGQEVIIRPISRNAAAEFLAAHHRHLRRSVTGWLFGCTLTVEGVIVGIACAGRPTARMLQDGVTLEITRVATLGAPNGCSRLYGALRKAGLALGYTRFVTYTRADEPGTSPRAAGFRCEGEAGGGEATRPGRPRRPSEDPSVKVRWVWP